MVVFWKSVRSILARRLAKGFSEKRKKEKKIYPPFFEKRPKKESREKEKGPRSESSSLAPRPSLNRKCTTKLITTKYPVVLHALVKNLDLFSLVG